MRMGAMLAVLVLLAFPSLAQAGELIMYRRAGCVWCLAWDREIGPAYPRSDVGRRVPVRFVDLDADPAPDIALKSPIRYTPTFVLVEDGGETGRIEGYPGEDFFWGRLERLVADGTRRMP